MKMFGQNTLAALLVVKEPLWDARCASTGLDVFVKRN
jgi:hypothetical protein